MSEPKNFRIKVMSRSECERFTREFHDEPFYVISIKGPRSAPPDLDSSNTCMKDVLQLVFDDIDYAYCGYGFTTGHAIEILNWCDELPDDALLIIHCRAGVSRSAAVAAALTEIYNQQDGSEFWRYPPYSPNTLVYQTLLVEQYRYEVQEKTLKLEEENRNQAKSYRMGID